VRLTIFGATGKTGRHLVEQALLAGHHVTAFVREPAKLGIENDRLYVTQGELSDNRRVQAAVAWADAVLSVLGPSHNRPTYDISLGTAGIVDAMCERNVHRLIVSVGAGVGDERDRPTVADHIITSLLRISAGNVLKDMVRTAQVVRSSELDWTLVRVPMLTDDRPTGTVRVGYLGNGVGRRLARADMASFILGQIAERQHLQCAPVISN
jgi:putative NADH-flavin reductase